MINSRYRIVVMGSSAGGLNALSMLFSGVTCLLTCPIVVVQHLYLNENDSFAQFLNKTTKLNVKEVENREVLKAGNIYIAPSDYHILLERNSTISLSVEDKVSFSRPSIDVLFESAVYAYGSDVIGIILTGANDDGAAGIRAIKKAGGTAIVQSPETAYCGAMPAAAIDAAEVDYVLPLDKIAAVLVDLIGKPNE